MFELNQLEQILTIKNLSLHYLKGPEKINLSLQRLGYPDSTFFI